MVKLPADTCPACHANMRTGHRPAELEEKTSFWHRRWGRAAFVLALIIGPLLIYSLGYGNLGDLLKGGLAQFGLANCAEPRNRWDDFSQEDFEKNVRSGYASWRNQKPTRRIGESPTGPESSLLASRTPEQKLQRQDTLSYFATSLMSDGPSRLLKAENNWYLPFNGEWDVAYSLGKDDQERIMAGEWVFSWINNGEALEDVLSIPFRWLKPPLGQSPIYSTTIRHFNTFRQSWEGFHIQNGQMFYFGAQRNQNKIIESYQVENGPIVAWIFEEIERESFKVIITQSDNNGSSYQQMGQIWAKRRALAPTK
jgi:hypothetical protein